MPKPKARNTKTFKREKISLEAAVGFIDTWHEVEVDEDDEAFNFELGGLDIFLDRSTVSAMLITNKDDGKKRIKLFEEDGDMTVLIWKDSERVYIDSEKASIQLISE